MSIEYYKDQDSGDFLTVALWDLDDDPYAEGGDAKQSEAPAKDTGNTTDWGLNNQWREIADAIITNKENIDTNTSTKANNSEVIKKDGSVAFTGDQDMGTNLITGLGAPSSDNHAARKKYVDDNFISKVLAAVSGNVAIWNSQGELQDSLRVLPDYELVSLVSVYLGSNQSEAVSDVAIIELDTKVVDIASEWDTSNYRLEPSEDGIYYIVGVQTMMQNDEGTKNRVMIYKNASPVYTKQIYFYTGGSGEQVLINFGMHLLQLDSTDYIDMRADHQNGNDPEEWVNGQGKTQLFAIGFKDKS